MFIMDDLEKRKTSLVRKIFYLPIMSTIMAITIISGSYFYIMSSVKQKELSRFSNQLLKEHKSLIKNDTINLTHDMTKQLSLAEKKVKQEIKNRVHYLGLILDKLSKTYGDEMLFQDILNSVRFSNKEYFFAYDRKTGVVKAHILIWLF